MTRKSILLLCCLLLWYSDLDAQKYLVLEKPGKVKNFKYQEGDKISLQVFGHESEISGLITGLTDSSVIINTWLEVNLNKITCVYRSRSFVKGMSSVFFIRGGLAYFTIVGINRGINHEYPIIDESTITVSAVMLGIGFLIKPLIVRHLPIGQRWRIKVINFSTLE